jgi:poly(beta-D-mannuronate) lyase
MSSMMKGSVQGKFAAGFVAAMLVLCFAPAAAGSAALVSPWDKMPVQLTEAPYACAPSPPIAPDLLVTRGLGKSGLSPAVKQAVYPESDEALHDLTERTVDAADAYRHSGSRAAARCVVSLLATAAADHAMAGYMASGDATKEQNLALRTVAIAYLKVRSSGVVSADEQALIGAWFKEIARRERARIESDPCGQNICGAHGHHGISVVMAAAAVAVADNDRRLFSWAVGQYRFAVRQIDERGMLHFDTHGQYALKFSLVSAACLVQIAEFGAVNGIDLYGFDHGRIHLLVHTVSRGLIDSGPYSAATGAKQRVPAKIEPWEVTWAASYNRRFPDPVLTGLLEQVGEAGAEMWGGDPGI